MGVRSDKYIGYTINIKDEWDKLSTEQQDLWLDSKTKEEGIYQPYYCKGDMINKISIIVDGMSGEYTKLIYVIDCCNNAYDDDNELVNTINYYLEKVAIPNNIKDELYRIYKEIFRVECSKEHKIRLEYFIHWH